MLALSAIAITLALACYSIGVWAERIARRLKGWHVHAFWTGFFFDAGGTYGMHRLAEGGINPSLPHTLTGQLAIWLMLAHAIWATWVALRGSAAAKRRFTRFSVLVWLIWLVPYFSPMFFAIGG